VKPLYHEQPTESILFTANLILFDPIASLTGADGGFSMPKWATAWKTCSSLSSASVNQKLNIRAFQH